MTAVPKITTMIPLTSIRPSSMAWHHRRLTHAPHIEPYARDNQSDQHERNRPPEEARAPNPDRLQQGIFRDFPENHTNDERRARPVMPLEQISEAAECKNQDQ